MKTSEFFDSKYLAASDLAGREHKLTIDKIDVAEFENGRRPVLFFVNRKKGLTLNKTNSSKLKAQWGDEMNDWIGKEVIVYPDSTEFNGQTVACVRLRPVLAAVDSKDPNDDIPF